MALKGPRGHSTAPTQWHWRAAAHAVLALLLACALPAPGLGESGSPAVAPRARPPAPVAAQRPTGPRTGESPLAAVKTWGYQLRNIAPLEVARSPYDLVVLDFADGRRPFSPADVALMQRRPDGRKRLLLAYLSAGEAERYRDYWKNEWYLAPPAWLGPENPEWRGNYPVRYWDLGWQRLMFGEAHSYLDRIIAQGFDGVYLDRIDVHATWEKENPHARRQIMDFVAALSAYAKYRKPGFLVVAQNAEELLSDNLYLSAIDGIAKEDLLYGVRHTAEANSREDVDYSIAQLKRAKRRGKLVLVVEYLCRKEEIAKAEKRLRQELGFVSYVGPRTLHQLGLSEDDHCRPAGTLGRRVALVIGNGGYRHAARLNQPENEARAVAAALRRLGFSEVRERMNLPRAALEHELQRFAESARGAEWAVLHYAGQGIGLGEQSFVVPVDAELDAPDRVASEAVPVERLLEAVRPARSVRIAMLDACRENPFIGRMLGRGLSVPVSSGLEPREPGQPVVAVYASRCHAPAREDAAPMGGFTRALLDHLETPDLDLLQLLDRATRTLAERTGGAGELIVRGALAAGQSFRPAQAPAAPARTAKGR